MEISHLHLGFVLLLILWAMRFLERFWRRPKRLEHALRVQGLKGIPYRFPFGDVKQFLELRKEALARSMSLSHDIIPCVSPYIQCIMSQYGHSKLNFNLTRIVNMLKGNPCWIGRITDNSDGSLLIQSKFHWFLIDVSEKDGVWVIYGQRKMD